ncbi:MAG: hypothetical protein IJ869_01770 [Clostridiales bacterium]|nr:hypothetical protein [Clostridiales bacterium]
MINAMHHELLISYHKDRLRRLPRGRFGMHRGKQVMYITYDPEDKTVSSKHKKIVRTDSALGRFYYPLIKESQGIEEELRALEAEWKSTYVKAPREFKYPLKKRHEPIFTADDFMRAKCNQGGFENNENIEYNGQFLRSKNEFIACQALDKLGYECKVEIRFTPDGFTEFDPDVTYLIKELQKPVFLEIDGAMDKHGYFVKSEGRKEKYFRAGFREFSDVIFFRLNDAHSFDLSRLISLIGSSILANMNDILLP